MPPTATATGATATTRGPLMPSPATATATLPTATAMPLTATATGATATTRGPPMPSQATATATRPTATATATTKLFQPSIQCERTTRERGYDEPKVFEESLITRKLSRLSRELRIQAVVVKNTR